MKVARALAVLVFLPILAGILQFGALGQRHTLATSGAIIQPDVLTALQQDSKVASIISLTSPGLYLDLHSDATAGFADPQEVTAVQDAVLSRLGPDDFTLVHKYGVVPALLGYVTSDGVKKLASDPNVASVVVDAGIPVNLAQSVPLIKADVLQNAGFDGTGVNVAVLDTGIAWDHPDLQTSLIGEACFIIASQLCPDNSEYPPPHDSVPTFPSGRFRDPGHPARDDCGHGTHVSGIITSDGTLAPRGVAPGARVFAFKVGIPVVIFRGLTCVIDSGGALWALDCMADPSCLPSLGLSSNFKFDFINMSFGGGNYSTSCDGQSPVFQLAIELLRAKGTLSFASAGNDGSTTGIGWPACLSAVVSVGATYDADVGQQQWFPCTDQTTSADKVTCFSNSDSLLSLLAPGSVITSTSAFYLAPGVCNDASTGWSGDCSGTSMASPMAVGVAALVKQALPNGTPDEIADILKRTGVSVTDSRDASHIHATPRVNAEAAVEALTGYSMLFTFPGSPGLYENCLADIQQQETNPTGKILCYFDSPGITVNPHMSGVSSCPPANAKYCGDGQAGAPPPGCSLGANCVPSAPNCSSLPCDVSQYQFADVDASHTQLSGFLDLSSHNMNLSGCFQDFDGFGQWGNVYVQAQINSVTGAGSASVYKFQSLANCTAGTPSGTALAATVNAVRLLLDSDSDGDGCPDKRELADTAGGVGTGGGLRDPMNRWDYFNPEKANTPQTQTVADILYVVGKYGKNQGNAIYTIDTDRTALMGGNTWNLGPPDGQQTVADILAAVKQYNQNC
jgi:subtilisin family serine protease